MRRVLPLVPQNVQLTWASALDTVPDMSPETLSELADFIFGDRPMVDMPVAVRGRVLASMSKAQRDKIRTAEGQAATARQLCLRVEQMRIYNFLAAAAQSNQDQIKTMISQGISPDACDYDRRTGLMLACHEGSEAVARLLLESGADAMAKDNFGNTASEWSSRAAPAGCRALAWTAKRRSCARSAPARGAQCTRPSRWGTTT